MHPVARFAHSLKRLFTTCRVFSGSFTGKAWCKQEQFKSTLSTTLMHVRTSWYVHKKTEGGVEEARPSYKSCSSDALESQSQKNAKCLALKGHGPVLTSRAWHRTQNKLKALLPPFILSTLCKAWGSPACAPSVSSHGTARLHLSQRRCWG